MGVIPAAENTEGEKDLAQDVEVIQEVPLVVIQDQDQDPIVDIEVEEEIEEEDIIDIDQKVRVGLEIGAIQALNQDLRALDQDQNLKNLALRVRGKRNLLEK